MTTISFYFLFLLLDCTKSMLRTTTCHGKRHRLKIKLIKGEFLPTPSSLHYSYPINVYATLLMVTKAAE